MAQRGEFISMSGGIRTCLVYSGRSWPAARHALGLAVVKASRLKLAYRVHILRDYQPIIVVNVEH